MRRGGGQVRQQQDSNNKERVPGPNGIPSVWTAQVDPDANEDHTDSTVAKRTSFIKKRCGGWEDEETSELERRVVKGKEKAW